MIDVEKLNKINEKTRNIHTEEKWHFAPSLYDNAHACRLFLPTHTWRVRRRQAAATRIHTHARRKKSGKWTKVRAKEGQYIALLCTDELSPALIIRETRGIREAETTHMDPGRILQEPHKATGSKPYVCSVILFFLLVKMTKHFLSSLGRSLAFLFSRKSSKKLNKKNPGKNLIAQWPVYVNIIQASAIYVNVWYVKMNVWYDENDYPKW